MSTTTLNRFGSLNSAAKNPLAGSIESIAIGVAKLRSITDNQLTHRYVDMEDLGNDLDRIDNEIGDWLAHIEVEELSRR